MYFPKSQITANLYTNGREFIYPNSLQEYTGYYFKTSDGKYYTGRNPNDPPVQEIIIEIQSQTEDAEEGAAGSYTADANLYLVPDAYASAINLNINSIPPLPPLQIVNLPTEEDYQISEFQRYFATKFNEIKYIEIDFKQYDKFINEEPTVDYKLYGVFSFPWLISGNRNDVYNVNKNTIERTQSTNSLQGFKSYFSDNYTQYFKYVAGSNLTTNGTEFLNERTGKRYVGLYHIHPKKGPMVGAEHTTQIHDYLIPVSGSNMGYKVNKMETQNSQNKNTKYVGY